LEVANCVLKKKPVMAKATKELMIPDELVMNKIYIIRGKKVMLDEDLADLYQVVTKRLNEQVRRNIERFPDDFMFRLNSRWHSLNRESPCCLAY